MTRWDAFADVCGYLRAGLLGGKPPRRRRNRDWKLLIEMSSFHYVTPSLAGCLRDEPGIPREIREYLDAVLALNGQRNAILLDALSRIVSTFNAIDIEPVLMKGCARLVEGDYPQSNMRFLGDLDVLVPTNRATDAFAALTANGFGEKPGEAYPPDHHHLQARAKDRSWRGNPRTTVLPGGTGPKYSRRHGFVREPGRSVCKIICTSACRTRPAARDTMLYTTNFTTMGIRTAQSSYANFLTLHSSASDTRRRSTGPNSTIFFVERALVRCSRPICNFAKSCWDRRRLSFATGPASARSKTFAGSLIRRSHRNHRHLLLL